MERILSRKEELIKNYKGTIVKSLENIYSSGYTDGYHDCEEQIKKMREPSVRVAGPRDEEYEDEWDDHTPFYGWCNTCNQPHSGRWAHMWAFCPWCGGKIDYSKEQPYPCGIKNKGE